jgi:hypothetical protein
MEPEKAAPAWGPVRRLLFRFTFAYLVLYIFPFPLNVFPPSGFLIKPYEALWNAVVPWVGQHVFGIEITVQPNGSGDTTWNYVQIFCFLVLALAATAVWTLFDRRRKEYGRLHEWLRAYVRFSLGTAMVSYGAFKVIQSQFPGPFYGDLLQTFGDSSPMGLLWRFMGASRAYNVFTGAAEMLGGLLLITRRTTLLGALVSAAVMGNVFMLNMSYDVPVKLYSFHLLAMAVFLTLPDLRRLADLFLFNRRVEPARFSPLFEKRAFHRGALAFRAALLLGAAAFALSASYQGATQFGDLAPRPPLHGLWEVDEFEMDGKVLPPLLTDPLRWRRMVFEIPGMVVVHLMDGSRKSEQYYNLKLEKSVLRLTKPQDPKWKSALSFKQPGPGLLAVEGTFEGRKLRANLHRVDDSKFLLTNRGFHWINEYPFNR